MRKEITRIAEIRGDIVCLENQTCWRVARYNVAALDAWKLFDQVEIGGLVTAPLLTNVRRAQAFRANRLEHGKE